MNNTEIKKRKRRFTFQVKGWVNKCGNTWMQLLSHKENEIVTNSQGEKVELYPESYFFKFKTNQFDFKGIGYVMLEFEPCLKFNEGINFMEITGWIRSAKYKNNETGKIEDVPKIETVKPVEPKETKQEEEIKMSDIF